MTDTWELRHIVTHGLDADGISRRFDPIGESFDERDVYLLTDSPALNLKVRCRGNTVKLKVLQDRTAERYEQWRTQIDEPLPVGERTFREILRLLNADGDPGALGATTRALDVVAKIRTLIGDDRVVSMVKNRRLLRDGNRRVDLARFQVPTESSNLPVWRSVGIESATLADLDCDLAHELRQLGTPMNYMEFLHGGARA